MAKSLKDIYDETVKQHRDCMEVKNPEKLDEVIEQYNVLLNQVHNEDTLLFHLATGFHQKGWNGLSIWMYQCLTEKYKDNAELWCNLGSCYKGEHKDEKARECWEKAIALDPRPEYFVNMSTLYVNQGNPEPGIQYALKAIEADPNNIKAHWNYAMLLLEAARWKDGFREYDTGILTKDRPDKQYSDKPIPYYAGQDLTNKTIVIYGEQGLGDEIMCVSGLEKFVKLYPGMTVILDVHERLENTYKRTFPGLPVYCTRKDLNTIPEWANQYSIDYRIAMGSLFRWVGIEQREAYLKPDLSLVEKMRERLKAAGPGPYIGISWAAGSKTTHSHERSFKLTPLAPILEQKATFISLQYHKEAREKTEAHFKNTGIQIHHWPDVVEAWLEDGVKSPGFDYDHTLALLCALDLIVVPNTTAVHACGALGIKCISLTPDAHAWRYSKYFHESQMPFYKDHVRLIRENGDWDKAIALAAEEVKKLSNKRNDDV